MRIGIDGRYAFRTQRRGIGEYVAQLLSQFATLCDEEFVVYIDRPAEIESLSLPPDRFRVERLNVVNPLLFEEVYLPRAVARDHLDLLHLTANYGPTIPPCATVYTVHDVIEFMRGQIGRWHIDWRHSLGRTVRTRTLRSQARRARAIIVPSEATKRDVVRVLGIEDNGIYVIPHGAPEVQLTHDPGALRESLRRRGYAVPETYFLAFGALDPRKNGETVVGAFSQIAEDFSDVELWLVGIENIDKYTHYQYPWLRMYPYIPKDDASDLLKAATGFVYPSRYEGFGFPALEAMACGVPLIAASSSAIPEVVGGAGLMLHPDDVSGFSSAMRRVLTDADLRQRLRMAGLSRAAGFDWQESAMRHLTLYRQVGR